MLVTFIKRDMATGREDTKTLQCNGIYDAISMANEHNASVQTWGHILILPPALMKSLQMMEEKANGTRNL